MKFYKADSKTPDVLKCSLESLDLEAQFRLEGLTRDTRVVSGLMLLSIIFQILSFPTDLELLSGSETLYAIWFVRGASAVIALTSVFLLQRSRGNLFEIIVFFWAAFLLAGIALANAMLPMNYTIHVAWDLFLTLAVYAVVPLPLNRQVIAASIITVGDIMLFWQYKALTWPVALIDIIAAFVCANLVGIFTSWELKHRKQREFQALRHEADIRHNLERALGEIRTLKGIIPICSNCKMVRTDEGSWSQVEDYVCEHTEAQFSHGICPDCLKKLYSMSSEIAG